MDKLRAHIRETTNNLDGYANCLTRIDKHLLLVYNLNQQLHMSGM